MPDTPGPHPLLETCDASCAVAYAQGDHWCRGQDTEEDIVTVTRTLVYKGRRSWVQATLDNCYVPLDGVLSLGKSSISSTIGEITKSD